MVAVGQSHLSGYNHLPPLVSDAPPARRYKLKVKSEWGLPGRTTVAVAIAANESSSSADIDSIDGESSSHTDSDSIDRDGIQAGTKSKTGAPACAEDDELGMAKSAKKRNARVNKAILSFA